MRARSPLFLAVALLGGASFPVVLAACSDDPVAAQPVPDAAPPPVEDAAPPEAAPPPIEVPASLVQTLSVKPYVEDSCVDTTFAGWPYEAKKCTYRTSLVVTVANPAPERVGAWIVEASKLIPALDGLKERDRASWEKGLQTIALHTLSQSSRIFPLAGQIWENGTTYKFERGVTSTCSSGCYCRVNSTSRQQWCKYADQVLGKGDEKTCLATMGQSTSKLTEAWLAQCMANHVASWKSDANENYRAMAWNANQGMASKFPDPKTAVAADVLAALAEQYPR